MRDSFTATICGRFRLAAASAARKHGGGTPSSRLFFVHAVHSAKFILRSPMLT